MSNTGYEKYLDVIRSAERANIIKASFQGAIIWKTIAAEHRIEPRHYPGLRDYIRAQYHSDGRRKTEAELSADIEQRKLRVARKNKYYRQKRALMRAQ